MGRGFFLPFGRRIDDNQRNAGEDRILVGRQGERAFLINLLCNVGGRAAVLITGRRGSGKSLFVEHCLREYEESVFKRYVRSDHGQPIVGIIFLLCLALLIPFALLIVTDFLEILVPNTEENKLLWILIFPLSIICLMPAVYGLSIASSLIRIWVPENKRWGAVLLLLIVAAAAYYSLPVHSPVMSLTGLLAIIGVIINFRLLQIVHTSFKEVNINLLILLSLSIAFWWTLKYFIAESTPTDWFFFVFIAVSVLTVTLVSVSFVRNDWIMAAPVKPQGDISSKSYFSKTIFLLVFWVISLGVIGLLIALLDELEFFSVKDVTLIHHYKGDFIRAVGCLSLFSILMTITLALYKGQEKPQHTIFQCPIRALLTAKVVFLFLVSIHLLAPVNPLFQITKSNHIEAQNSALKTASLENQDIYPAIVFARILSDKDSDCQALNTHQTHETKGSCFDQYFRYWFKGINSAPPEPVYLNAYVRGTEFPLEFKVVSPKIDLSKLDENVTPCKHTVPAENLNQIECLAKGLRQTVTQKTLNEYYVTLFNAPLEEGLWFFLVALLLLLFFFLEYEWISKPRVTERNSRVINPFEGRSVFSNPSDKLTRDIAVVLAREEKVAKTIAHERIIHRVTFVWWISKIWMPSIIVRVNLGFEHLKHESVTRAMLTGLRAEYSKRFLSRTSAYVLISAFLSFFVLLYTTKFISETAFSLPQMQQVELSQKQNDSKKPNESQKPNESHEQNKTEKPCDILTQLHGGTSTSNTSQNVPLTLCASMPRLANFILPVLYYSLIEIPVGENNLPDHIVFNILDSNATPPSQWYGIEPSEDMTRETVSLRVYHTLILILLISLMKWVFGTSNPFLPYKKTLSSIDNALRALTGETTTRRKSIFPLSNKLSGIFASEREVTFNEARSDPRSVELMMLDILNEIRQPQSQLPFSTFISSSIPKPEVTFLFDELDKVSGTMGAELSVQTSSEADIQEIDAERRRAYALHALLSDMKRIISSAPARFIFVGSRLLHDEVIADSTRREAHLTSIFDTEIYLPSLLVDNQKTPLIQPSHSWDDRVWEYLSLQYEASTAALNRAKQNSSRPYFLLKRNSILPLNFSFKTVWAKTINGKAEAEADGGTGSTAGEKDHNPRASFLKAYRIDNEGTYLVSELDPTWNRHLVDSIIGYLTLKSAGNPKKLKHYFEQLLRPKSRALSAESYYVASSVETEDNIPDSDGLYLPTSSGYRVQLINYLYRHLKERFSDRVVWDDDKSVVSLFYLFEFLLKFHGRAFAWSSLERIDELAHIHRSPNVRNDLRELVEESSERFMHDVLNGLYSFRFRGEFSAELNYISRLHEFDQEAFNFTLDESQNLKATYNRTLDQSKATNIDLIFGLGELHEYDQEYETARHHYRHCIRLHDATLFYHARHEATRPDSDKTSAKDDLQLTVLSGLMNDFATNDEGPIIIGSEQHRIARAYLPWGPKRVRYMLHIAMTEELTGNLNTAMAHYANTLKLSEKLISILCANGAKGASDKDIYDTYDLAIAKHMNVLFQPIFASAWVAEKLDDGVDTSVTLVETSLRKVRDFLPFTRSLEITFDKNSVIEALQGQTENTREAVTPQHSNFALTMSELHNKAGDLYYLKGRDGLPLKYLETLLDPEKSTRKLKKSQVIFYPGVTYRGYGSGTEGHSFRAHYHYCLGVHEIRRFLFYRGVSSRLKFNHLKSYTDKGVGTSQAQLLQALKGSASNPLFPTIGKAQWPSYVYKGLYNNITDIGDTYLARVSYAQVMRELFELSADMTGDNIDRYTEKSLIWSNETTNGKRTFWLETDPNKFRENIVTFLDHITDWMEFSDQQTLLSSSTTNMFPDIDLNEMFGHWRAALKEEGARKPLESEMLVVFGKASAALDRLLTGNMLILAGAELAVKGGRPESAAREYLRLSELIQFQLSTLRTFDFLRDIDPTLPNQKPLEVITLLKQHYSGTLKAKTKLVNGLAAMSRYALEEYSRLSSEVWHEDNEDYQVGTVIHELAVTNLCGLSLHILSLSNTKDRDEFIKFSNKKLKSWLGESYESAIKYPHFNKSGPQLESERYINIVHYLIDRHPFPIFNRLKAMKLLLDENSLTRNKGECAFTVGDLKTVFEQFNAPLYFSDTELAQTCALSSLSKNRPPGAAADNIKTEFKNEIRWAQYHFREAKELVSMGTAYYRAIANRYYLYDDFNDRQLHATHAVQMLSLDLNNILSDALK